MYITRLVLNPESKSARLMVERPYEMHRTLVTRLFDGHQDGVLFRTESLLGQPPTVLVQSQQTPDLLWLSDPQRGGYVIREYQTKPLSLDGVCTGDRFRFRLRANPVKKDDEGRRRALETWDEWTVWIHHKGERHGFRCLDVAVSFRQVQRVLLLRKGRHSTSFMLNVVQYEGVLQADDGEKLIQAVVSGVGRGKFLGCGLLSLMRL